MEHIGNYLDKYRKMIAEHDAQKQLFEVVDSLQVALIEQGRQIKELQELCNEYLKKHEDNKHQG